jgi:hypothetical protein
MTRQPAARPPAEGRNLVNSILATAGGVIGDNTMVDVRIGGAPNRITLGTFLADNRDDDGIDRDAIVAALEAGRTYRGGGGASPEWSIRVAS